MIFLGLSAILLIAAIPPLCCKLEERGHFVSAEVLEGIGALALGSCIALVVLRLVL